MAGSGAIRGRLRPGGIRCRERALTHGLRPFARRPPGEPGQPPADQACRRRERGRDAVRMYQENDDQHATRDEREPLGRKGKYLRADRARHEHRADERSDDEADPADQRLAHGRDRLEAEETAVHDVVRRKREQYPAQRGDGRRQAEGVELDAPRADAKSRRPARQRRRLVTATAASTKRTKVKAAYRSGCSTPSMLRPKRWRTPTVVPRRPPVYRGFWKTIWSIAAPRPSVMMASFTPRVRTAGSANSSPIGTVPTTPITRAASNGMIV